MKARVIKTGEIIDVVSEFNPNAISASDILYSSNFRTYKGWELDFTNIRDEDIDWEQRRYEIAKTAIQGLLSNQNQVDYACSEVNYNNRPIHVLLQLLNMLLLVLMLLLKNLKNKWYGTHKYNKNTPPKGLYY